MLGNAATELRRVVEATDVCGTVVYAGGDDFLALIPAQAAPSVLDSLDTAFKGSVSPRGWLPGSEFSISAAMLLMPFSDPLSGAVEETGNLLGTVAKEQCGRSAAAATVRRQSGQQTVCGMKFSYSHYGELVRPWQDIQQLALLFHKGVVSGGAIESAVSLGPSLPDFQGYEELCPLIRHIFGQDRSEAALPAVTKLLRASVQHSIDAGPGERPAVWETFSSCLILARFLGGLTIG